MKRLFVVAMLVQALAVGFTLPSAFGWAGDGHSQDSDAGGNGGWDGWDNDDDMADDDDWSDSGEESNED